MDRIDLLIERVTICGDQLRSAVEQWLRLHGHCQRGPAELVVLDDGTPCVLVDVVVGTQKRGD